jgi:hypothetical protein
MYFLVERDSQEVVARFSSKDYGLTVGRLMARHKKRVLELRRTEGGVAVAIFSDAGEMTRLDN